jgi:hypothetical protein
MSRFTKAVSSSRIKLRNRFKYILACNAIWEKHRVFPCSDASDEAEFEIASLALKRKTRFSSPLHRRKLVFQSHWVSGTSLTRSTKLNGRRYRHRRSIGKPSACFR